jgi:Cu-processing system permease protein
VSTTLKILRYELRDLLRSRWLLGYLLFFVAFAEALYRMQGSSTKVLLNLVDVVLLLIPLASGVFGAIYLYGAREFSELLLSQPVGRRQLFSGLYLGLAGSLSAAFVVGTAAPFLLRGMDTPDGWATLGAICLAGAALTWISVALAFLVALRLEDRMKGLATVILGWLALAVVYDGAVLLALNAFSDLPTEPGLLAATVANPVDLARVVLLLRFDIAALMGYTGEAFSRFFGGAPGALTAALATTLWVAVPVALGARMFRRKDF